MNKNETFNKTISETNKNIEKLNKQLKSEYEKNGDLKSFAKYIMSELLAPIEDYENIVKLIRENYKKHISLELLIIGAYSAIYWMNSNTEMLKMLNLMRPFLPDYERAIIHYLNAYKMFMTDDDYLSKQEYRVELNASLIAGVPFVNNRLMIAELTGHEARKYYSEALDNVKEVFSENKNTDATVECLLNPQSFIKEFILGLYMCKKKYDDITIKISM